MTSLTRKSSAYGRGRALFDHLWHDAIEAHARTEKGAA